MEEDILQTRLNAEKCFFNFYVSLGGTTVFLW